MDYDIASARIADSLLPGGIHHFPDPEKLLLKKGAKRKDDGRAIASSTPCLGSIAECIVNSVSNIQASSITSRRNALLAKPQTLKDAEGEVHVELRSMRKGTDEEPMARRRLRVTRAAVRLEQRKRETMKGIRNVKKKTAPAVWLEVPDDGVQMRKTADREEWKDHLTKYARRSTWMTRSMIGAFESALMSCEERQRQCHHHRASLWM